MKIRTSLALFSLLLWISGLALSEARAPPKAELVFRTCSCSLGKFPEMQDFLQEDLVNFGSKVAVDYLPAGTPRLAVLNPDGSDREIVDVKGFSRRQLRELVVGRGYNPLIPLDDIFEDGVNLQTSEL